MTGAIICGGKSTRMGRPKAGLPLTNGRVMIEHVYDVLRSCCPHIILAGSPPDLPDSLRGLERVGDRIEGAGPMGGLEALLDSGIDREYLVVPCDLPCLESETLQLLMGARGKLPLVLNTKQHLQPLVARYDIDLLPEIHKRLDQGLSSLKALLYEVGYTPVPVPPHLNHTLQNVNTVNDFNKFGNTD